MYSTLLVASSSRSLCRSHTVQSAIDWSSPCFLHHYQSWVTQLSIFQILLPSAHPCVKKFLHYSTSLSLSLSTKGDKLIAIVCTFSLGAFLFHCLYFLERLHFLKLNVICLSKSNIVSVRVTFLSLPLPGFLHCPLVLFLFLFIPFCYEFIVYERMLINSFK